MLPPAGPATTLRGPAIVPPPVRLTAATQQANTNQPVAGPSNLRQPATRHPAMPPPLPIHNRPHTNLQFHVETPEGMRQRLSRVTPSGPTRNMNKNKQQATTILFTPNRRSEQRQPELHSNSSSPSPTPAGQTGDVFVEPELSFQRLNLDDPVDDPEDDSEDDPEDDTVDQRTRTRGEGPLHGRPGRKAPGRKRTVKRLQSDVWTFMDANGQRDKKTCIFCQCVKVLFSSSWLIAHYFSF